MSVGVNLLLHLVQTAAKVMGETADIEIIEAHHQQRLNLTAATVRAGSELIGVDAGELAGCGKVNVSLSQTSADSVSKADIW
ncbi:UNVERIFIED_CONTAM: dapB, partial [Trichonephila clavipes]